MNLLRQCQECLTHVKYRKSCRCIRKDQSCVCITDTPVSDCQVVCDDDRLARDHHGCQHDIEQDFFALELHHSESIGCKSACNNLSKCDDTGYDQRVLNESKERCQLECSCVVLDGQMRRPELSTIDLFQIHHTNIEAVDNRNDNNNCKNNIQRIHRHFYIWFFFHQ